MYESLQEANLCEIYSVIGVTIRFDPVYGSDTEGPITVQVVDNLTVPINHCIDKSAFIEILISIVIIYWTNVLLIQVTYSSLKTNV